jgi:hypothetical protein
VSGAGGAGVASVAAFGAAAGELGGVGLVATAPQGRWVYLAITPQQSRAFSRPCGGQGQVQGQLPSGPPP